MTSLSTSLRTHAGVGVSVMFSARIVKPGLPRIDEPTKFQASAPTEANAASTSVMRPRTLHDEGDSSAGFSAVAPAFAALSFDEASLAGAASAASALWAIESFLPAILGLL